MKKCMNRFLAAALIVVMICAMIPSAFAAQTVSLNMTEYSFGVGLGTKFADIGLPTTAYVDDGITAAITWNQGNYNGEKEGTYTLTGTAKVDGGYVLSSSTVTAVVSVTDVGFTLAPLPDSFKTRNHYPRSGKKDSYKEISCVPLVKNFALNDYQWSYRWYLAKTPTDRGEVVSTDKDLVIDRSLSGSVYYYCKVTCSKNGVSKTLTTNRCRVEFQDELFNYDFVANVEEIVPGETFSVTMTIGILGVNGEVEEQYVSTLYPQTYVFSSKNPDLLFEDRVVTTLGGTATTKVITKKSLKGVDSVDINCHITGDISKNWFYNLPPFDLDVPLTLKVAGNKVVEVVEKSKSAYFSDVTAAWNFNEIDSMFSNGYMKGTSNTTFSPNASMNRAMLVTTLYRMAGSPSVAGLGNKFTDVSVSDYYYNAVLWASNNGIVNGTSASQFSPNAKVSRQDLAAILYRYEGQPNIVSGKLDSYKDAAAVASYASGAMNWATNEGIIGGVNGQLEPTGNATRGQVAVMLYRYLTK